ncbi:phosphoribosyltransferase [Yinghuangia seranimata]|uniref:phosphoribosyltransferase n=1 Tax=Yinghuangia seranimata TaxID=408067 RepID=UPI00248C5514|nr:phosphoribosyltransferase [Yinghuangia seranimata]MDI2124654.1 phosphoribosyltransferase [Yinghuangia seranimata]
MTYADRREAGMELAPLLEHLRGADVVVVGLPRGGVPVAYEVARSLGAPLDVIAVRKLGAPFQPELAMGAIGEDGTRVLHEEVLRGFDISGAELADAEERAREEIAARTARWRADRDPVPLKGRTAVVVDDGVATGSTARAACQVARARGAERVVLAVPVGPPDLARAMADVADEVVCAMTPVFFHAVAQGYVDFTQTTDDEVTALLDRAAHPEDTEVTPDPPAFDDEVEVDVGPVRLPGHLTLPDGASGAVVFAHGSGSSRHSPRNRAVAAHLNRAGLGTLLFDLLTLDEEPDRDRVFDIPFLAERLLGAVRWLRRRPDTTGIAIGVFGASTGAGAALWAAAEHDSGISAVVSRGGRPDLAADRLDDVTAPTLLIVGGNDPQVLALNHDAYDRLPGTKHLTVVSGATHLFEEPGAMNVVAGQAARWFTTHL